MDIFAGQSTVKIIEIRRSLIELLPKVNRTVYEFSLAACRLERVKDEISLRRSGDVKSRLIADQQLL